MLLGLVTAIAWVSFRLPVPFAALLRGRQQPPVAGRAVSEFCHSTGVPSPSILKHLLKAEGGAAK